MNETTEKLKQIQALIVSAMSDINGEKLGATGEILSDNLQEMLNTSEQSIYMLEMLQSTMNNGLSEENTYIEQPQNTGMHM